jgi:hypothetical protein
MRVRRTLVQCGFLNLWLGSILVIAPFITPAAKKTVLGVVLDFTYGGGFLLATLLCLAAYILWSERIERRGAITLIQQMRIAALTLAFSMCLAFCAIALYAAAVAGWSLNAIELLGLAAVVLIVEGAALSDGDLTPIRERHIWGQPQAKGHKRWTQQWQRLLWWR